MAFLVLTAIVGGVYYLTKSLISADISDLTPKGETKQDAKKYLNALKAKIDPNFWDSYILSDTIRGVDGPILKNVSTANSENDYEAFTRARAQIFNFIAKFTGSDLRASIPPNNKNLITGSISPQSGETGENLLTNGGFELSSNNLPGGWQDRWRDGGSKQIDKSTKRSGSSSWKFTQNDDSKIQGGLSDFIAVKTDATYKFAAWVKTASKTHILVQFYEYADNTSQEVINPATSYIGTGNNYEFDSPQNWLKITTSIKPRDANTKYIRMKIASFKGTVWWDDLSLIDVGSDYLDPIGCKSESDSKCLDIGSSDEGIVDINSKMSPKKSENEITSRSILPKQTVEINIPSFNVDGDGIPLTPMLLEIRYKDTIKYVDAGQKADYQDRAMIFSKIGYQSKDMSLYGYGSLKSIDPDCAKTDPGQNEPSKCFPSDRVNYDIAKIGDINDGKWKYLQYPFPKTQLPLLKSIDNKFTFYIKMPSGNNYQSSELPIDYIGLKKITEADYQKLDEKQRELIGYYQINYNDEPTPAVSYPQKDLTLFTRDLMRPIFNNTKPRQDELGKDIEAFSTLGEIEPTGFGIYSETGVDNLEIEIDSLKGANDQIDKTNILIKKVVLDKRRLSPTSSLTYALIPDRLEKFNKLTLTPKTSQRIWLDIKIPENLKGGLYQGTVHIKKDSEELASKIIKIKILPIRLSEPNNYNYTWGDPINRTFSNDTDELYKYYKEHKISTLIQVAPNDYRVENENGEVTNVDFANLEKRIGELVSKGVIIPEQPINVWLFTSAFYENVYKGSSYSRDKDFYNKMNDPKFKTPYQSAIKKIIDIGKMNNFTFVFETTDEPNTVIERLYADRTTKFINELGGKTIADLTQNSEKALTKEDIAPYLADDKDLPIQPLSASKYLNNKIWNLRVQGSAFDSNHPNNYGYYTTPGSFLRTPLNNRFLHGLLAYKTNAKFVYGYAAGAWWNDPYRDFDLRSIWPIYSSIESDRVFAYPTWQGELIPATNGEGVKEGIKDAQYVATLEKLLEGDSASPTPNPSPSKTTSQTPVSPPAVGARSAAPPTPPAPATEETAGNAGQDGSAASDTVSEAVSSAVNKILGPGTAGKVISVAGIKSGVPTLLIAAIIGSVVIIAIIVFIIIKRRRGRAAKGENETPTF